MRKIRTLRGYVVPNRSRRLNRYAGVEVWHGKCTVREQPRGWSMTDDLQDALTAALRRADRAGDQRDEYYDAILGWLDGNIKAVRFLKDYQSVQK